MMELTVHDAAGKPLADATIEVATADMDFPLSVDKEGAATLNLPLDPAHLTLRAGCPGCIPLALRWRR